MPKELIHDDTKLPGEDNSTPLAVEVAWGRDSHVQLASIHLGKTDRQESDRGWYVDVDRSMINKVIRVLRRARDQAFGADE